MRALLACLAVSFAAAAQPVPEFTRPTPAAQQPPRATPATPGASHIAEPQLPRKPATGPGVAAEPPAGPKKTPPPTDPTARALEFAQRYPVTRHAWREVRRAAAELQDPSLRAAVEAQLNAPWLPAHAWAYAHHDEAQERLRALGLLAKDAPLRLPPAGKGSFFAAPGGPCPGGHHAYPGGLAVHSWLVLQHARGFAADYADAYGVRLDDSWLVAAALWHDSLKAGTLPWDESGSCGGEPQLAGTAEHHVLGIAAALLKRLPAPLVWVIASAHAPPMADRMKDICGWIRAASILASGTEDLVACPRLDDTSPKPPLEAYALHLGDADFAVTVPTWQFFSSRAPKGWDAFEALLQDGSDFAAWQRAQAH